MRYGPFAFLALLVLVTLAIGHFVGQKLNGPPPGPPTATLPAPILPSPTAPPEETIALLLIRVDSHQAAQPRFEACWIVLFNRGIPNYYVLSFPPESQVPTPESGALSLRDFYDTHARSRYPPGPPGLGPDG
jgi:hypothetical protein